MNMGIASWMRISFSAFCQAQQFSEALWGLKKSSFVAILQLHKFGYAKGTPTAFWLDVTNEQLTSWRTICCGFSIPPGNQFTSKLSCSNNHEITLEASLSNGKASVRGWQIEHHYQFLNKQNRIRNINKLIEKNFSAPAKPRGWKWNHKNVHREGHRNFWYLQSCGKCCVNIISHIMGFTLEMKAALKIDIW